MRVAAYLQKAPSDLPGSFSQDGRCSDKLDLLSPVPLRISIAHAQEPAEQGGQRCALHEQDISDQAKSSMPALMVWNGRIPTTKLVAGKVSLLHVKQARKT